MQTPCFVSSLIALIAAAFSPADAARSLTFEDRVAALRAIERVYYTHQQGATKPFDEAVPRAVLERKVVVQLKVSSAMERHWRTPATAEALAREWRRITTQTRLPERLKEIELALGNDPVLIQETLIRPVLEDRLARAFFESDERIHGRGMKQSRSWESWWAEVSDDLDEESVETVASPDIPTAEAEGGSGANSAEAVASFCIPDNTWDNGILDDAPDGRESHTAVWTGSQMIVWGGDDGAGTETYLRTGARYDPLTDTWTPTSTLDAPTARTLHSAVWSGSEMIIWGGREGSGSNYVLATNTGGRYDPVSDTWTPISGSGAPMERFSHSAVWTGSLMVVFGGTRPATATLPRIVLDTGGVYDPASDTWTPTRTTRAPSPRERQSAVWTGSEMIVWGGKDDTGAILGSGGRYNAATDRWTGVSESGSAGVRDGHLALWSGTHMIVWGGAPSGGVRYDPASDSWTPIAQSGAPSPGSNGSGVWTGSRMIVWGGEGAPGQLDEGGIYDPLTDSWSAVTTMNGPGARSYHSAVWTGARMIVWGGRGVNGAGIGGGGRFDPASSSWTPVRRSDGPGDTLAPATVWTGNLLVALSVSGGSPSSGGRYNPLLDAWAAVTSAGAPSAMSNARSVWSGNAVLAWGGDSAGGRYDPISDSWSPISESGAPERRWEHAAVWTGREMIVWGGRRIGTGTLLSTGGRYDPSSDRWSPVSNLAAPLPRFKHTAVWSGTEMIVWGGDNASAGSTGGRYDPGRDLWTPTSLTDAPARRSGHSATWIDSGMLIWGGEETPNLTNTGVLYNPIADMWSPISAVGAPSARRQHAAVWTGTEFLVWGGRGKSDSVRHDTGGRYHAGSGTWLSIALSQAPSPRFDAAAVWTGSHMIVFGGNLYETGGRYALGHESDDDFDGRSECQGDCNDEDASSRPGAAEICDGLDNDCDGFVPMIERDADADGLRVCAPDCDDNDPAIREFPIGLDGVWFEDPGIASMIHLVESGTSPPSGMFYDGFTGSLSSLRVTSGSLSEGWCAADGMTEPDYFDNEPDPPTGVGRYYLFRSQNACGTASWGTAERDGTAAASAAPCP